ncbi:MAG: hypothetical protein H6605_00375 [Flavobacteriales bacterium]|nr:hypothetical protein [Flavobacteriales bacterium]
MRVLEIALLILVFIYSVKSIFHLKFPIRRRFDVMALLSLFFLILHLFIDAPRWQMGLVYFLLLFFYVKDHFNSELKVNKSARSGRILTTFLNCIYVVLVLAMLVFTFSIGNVFPVTSSEEPTGMYKVGKSYFHFTDTDRSEDLTIDPADKRSLWVQVWYPGEINEASKTEPVFSNHKNYMNVVFEQLGIPEFMSSHLDLLKSHTYKNARISDAKESYPVILYSHGYKGYLANSYLMEELASNGYVVFAIAHPYESTLGMNELGKWVNFNDADIHVFEEEDPVGKNGNMPEWGKIRAILNKKDRISKIPERSPYLLDKVDRSKLDSLCDLVLSGPRSRLKVWTSDQKFVLDKIEKLNSGAINSIFKEKLDMNSVGAIGFSFGGAVSLNFCLNEPKCKASVNIDGDQYGIAYGNSTHKPYMMIWGQKGWANQRMDTDWENIGNGAPYHRVAIKGALHSNFNCNPYDLTVLQKLGIDLRGSIYQDLVDKIPSQYVLAFFDQYLKGEKTSLLNGETKYKEVKHVIYPFNKGINK